MVPRLFSFMLFLVISILPFLFLLSKSLLRQQPLPAWASEARLLSVLFLQELFSLRSFREFTSWALGVPSSEMACKRKCPARAAVAAENVGDCEEMSVLDLPELALECILEKLPPPALCSMAGVCRELKDRCRSDYLWRRHMGEKWGAVVGGAARREWDSYLASRKDPSNAAATMESCGSSGSGISRRWIESLACVWPLSWRRSRLGGGDKQRCPLPRDSVMSWYLSLESGRFWFPAQVYNREHGHVGFMLSCYDAELSYDSHTDSFQARYPPHGRRTVVIEEGVQWERIRAPPLDTPAHDLHASDCLHDLRPGDHIEIQWRRNKEFPYGWWYGIVGHLEPCDGSEHFCRCHKSETVVLEFNQYTPGSRWRRTIINRKDHREEGNEADGFYGGIRKLYSNNEIATWKRLWPVEVLE